jgi:hypothetical protein
MGNSAEMGIKVGIAAVLSAAITLLMASSIGALAQTSLDGGNIASYVQAAATVVHQVV